jgi:hypothetical protein
MMTNDESDRMVADCEKIFDIVLEDGAGVLLKKRKDTYRVARFFLVQTFQNGKSIPSDHKLYQTVIYYTKLA